PAGASGAGQEAAASAAPAPADGQPGSGNGSNGAFKDDAKIVRTGSLNVQVKDLDVALTAGRDAVRAAGGYVGASKQTNDGDNSVASVTYRIPSDRWEESLTALRRLGKVLGEQTDAIEVTGQLVDLQARIANLRASEQALQGIAAKATKISDVLEVESRLTEVRGQIEQLDGQRAHLADQAGLGTLTVTYGLQVVAVTQATKGWNAGDEVDRASATLVDILQSLARAGIWLGIVWLPILVTLGILAAIAAFVLRRLGFLRRAGSPAPPAAPAATAS
ncbi:MAG: DUF4349 domain-containing protein, partial [Chloroflexota bacterium]|nr:DUF4349 domain-containing protein [Chloroflexota bacterium]